MTTTEFNEIIDRAKQMKPWAFLDDILMLFYNRVDFGTIELYLDGGRKYGKTYNGCDGVSKTVLMLPKSVDAYLMRWMKGDSNELADELIDALERNLGEELTKTQMNKATKTFKINGNKIKVMGIHTPSSRKKVNLTGINRAKGKQYCIVIIEEAYEFTEKEILDIKQAIGGYKNFMFIYITNPNSLAIPFIEKREKEFPHDEETLKTKGFQFKVLYEPNHTTIWFYANWRINAFIEKEDVELILAAWNIDPNRARVVDYGMPGIEENGIYAQEYTKIKRFDLVSLLKTHSFKKFSSGIDWGDGSGPNASSTTCVIRGVDYKGNVFVLDTYGHNNHKDGYLSPQERCEAIVRKHIEFSKLRPEITYKPLVIKIDTGLYAEREFLQIASQELNAFWLHFEFATKYQERTRITMRKYLINTGRYYVATHLKEFMREIQLQIWDETKRDKQNLPKQQDANNHYTDADDYAGDESMYEFTQEAQYQNLYKKW